MLHGGPGSGKSCMLKHALKQMTMKGGAEYYSFAFTGQTSVRHPHASVQIESSSACSSS